VAPKAKIPVVGLVVLIYVGLGLLLEGGARVYYFFRQPVPRTYADARDPLDETILIQQNFTDRIGWEPFTYYRQREYDGKYVHIDAQGHRRTVGNSTAGDRLRIFIFGGSTVWGWGQDDASTLASLLIAELKPRGVGEIEIVNFGELSYVSGQDLSAFLQTLRYDPPHLAIFYGGANEGFSTFQNNQPGLAFNESAVKERVERDYRPSSFLRSYDFKEYLKEKSALARMTFNLRDRFAAAAKSREMASTAASVDQLGAASVDVYLKNVRAIRALAKEFRVEAHVFLQPVLLLKSPRAKDEDSFLAAVDFEPRFRGIVESFYSHLRPRTHEDSIVDLSEVFRDDATSRFTDWVHVNREANVQIARVIARHLLARSPLLRHRAKIKRAG